MTKAEEWQDVFPTAPHAQNGQTVIAGKASEPEESRLVYLRDEYAGCKPPHQRWLEASCSGDGRWRTTDEVTPPWKSAHAAELATSTPV